MKKLSKTITTELRTIWITPDGNYFLTKQLAEKHCDNFNLLKKEGEINEQI